MGALKASCRIKHHIRWSAIARCGSGDNLHGHVLLRICAHAEMAIPRLGARLMRAHAGFTQPQSRTDRDGREHQLHRWLWGERDGIEGGMEWGFGGGHVDGGVGKGEGASVENTLLSG